MANTMRYATWLAVELWEAATNINVLCMGQELAYHFIITLISGRCQSKKILQCCFLYYFNWNRLRCGTACSLPPMKNKDLRRQSGET